ncbi:MAG: hypothetical protein KJ569_00165, partial [Candidatus Omnitrophica bacterium]|nr:hypothetical protein [Candidatus Omnitrophota bacterium]
MVIPRACGIVADKTPPYFGFKYKRIAASPLQKRSLSPFCKSPFCINFFLNYSTELKPCQVALSVGSSPIEQEQSIEEDPLLVAIIHDGKQPLNVFCGQAEVIVLLYREKLGENKTKKVLTGIDTYSLMIKVGLKELIRNPVRHGKATKKSEDTILNSGKDGSSPIELAHSLKLIADSQDVPPRAKSYEQRAKIHAASPLKKMTLTPFFPIMPASRFVVVNVRDNELFLGVVSGKINLSNKTFKATTGTNIASNLVEQTIFQRIIEWMKLKRSLINKYKARKKAEGYIKANLKFSLREINQKIPLEEIPVEFRPQTPNNKLAELAIEESTRKIIFPWAIIVRDPPLLLVQLTLLEIILHYHYHKIPDLVHSVIDKYIVKKVYKRFLKAVKKVNGKKINFLLAKNWLKSMEELKNRPLGRHSEVFDETDRDYSDNVIIDIITKDFVFPQQRWKEIEEHLVKFLRTPSARVDCLKYMFCKLYLFSNWNVTHYLFINLTNFAVAVFSQLSPEDKEKTIREYFSQNWYESYWMLTVILSMTGGSKAGEILNEKLKGLPSNHPGYWVIGLRDILEEALGRLNNNSNLPLSEKTAADYFVYLNYYLARSKWQKDWKPANANKGYISAHSTSLKSLSKIEMDLTLPVGHFLEVLSQIAELDKVAVSSSIGKGKQEIVASRDLLAVGCGLSTGGAAAASPMKKKQPLPLFYSIPEFSSQNQKDINDKLLTINFSEGLATSPVENDSQYLVVRGQRPRTREDGLSYFIGEDNKKIECEDKKKSDIKDNFFIHWLFFVASLCCPKENYQPYYRRYNIKMEKGHIFVSVLFASLANLAAAIRKNILATRPPVKVSQGILPETWGKKTPANREPKRILPPSSKKFDIVVNSSEDSIVFYS